MQRLLYLVHGDSPRAQQELSYSVLSALKQGLGDCEILLACDEANQRGDLPVTHRLLPPSRVASWQAQGICGQLHVLHDVLAERRGPVCLIQTDTVFCAPPARLFERIAEQGALVLDRDGWLAGRRSWDAALSETQSKGQKGLLAPGTEMLNPGVIGLSTTLEACLTSAISTLETLPESSPIAEREQFCFSAALSMSGIDPTFASAEVRRYQGPLRHVYHGRFDSMFPPGAPVNTALAPRLPEITEPPKPFLLRLRARAKRLATGSGLAFESGYLAYLCAFAAPTATGRNVWANMALDWMQRSHRDQVRLQRDLPRLAPARLASADLSPETRARWQVFWQGAAR